MALKIARRASIPPFIAMDMLRAANERAARGEDILHLEVGQPGTGAPGPVLDAAKAVLETDTLGYTEAVGLPALRRRLAGHYRDCYGVDVDPGRVAVTTGSSGAFVVAFLCAFEAGDRVALASPGYPWTWSRSTWPWGRIPTSSRHPRCWTAWAGGLTG